MDYIKGLVEKNPSKSYACGLRTVPLKEIEELKEWLKTRNIPYVYKTVSSDGKQLPFNGTLFINPTEGVLTVLGKKKLKNCFTKR